MEKSEKILTGPEYTGKEFLGSAAEYIVPKIKSYGDKIAQVDLKTGESVTAKEFLRASLEVAEGLIVRGIEEGDVVVIAAPNSIRSYETAMGIIFSGAALSPIDRNLKPYEFQSLLQQFKPKLIFCEVEKAKEFRSNLNAIKAQTPIAVLDATEKGPGDDFYTLNDIRVDVDLDSYTPRKVKNSKTSPVVICCSSGSTGLPKGVILSHYSILTCVMMIECQNLNFDTSVLMNSPLFWISGIFFLVNSISVGQPACIPKSQEPKDLLEAIEKYKPFFVMLSPSSLLSVVEFSDFDKYNLDSVKLLLTGGSTLGAEVGDKIKKKWISAKMFQSYGSTETGGSITNAIDTNNLLSVGKVSMGNQLKIVDVQTGESLGPNKVGEVRIKSKCMMLGYYNNEKATKEAFDENGWFRTGDLGYYDEDNLIYLTGRIKEIIKYRNYQISPTEIESFLVCVPGVQDAAIVPVPHEEDHYHLKALIVKAPKSDITAEDIIQSVKDNFSSPKHLRKGVQFVNEIPRTGSGKLKRGEINKMI